MMEVDERGLDLSSNWITESGYTSLFLRLRQCRISSQRVSCAQLLAVVVDPDREWNTEDDSYSGQELEIFLV